MTPAERRGWRAGQAAAVARIQRFQDIFGWRFGETRNTLIAEITNAVAELEPVPGSVCKALR